MIQATKLLAGTGTASGIGLRNAKDAIDQIMAGRNVVVLLPQAPGDIKNQLAAFGITAQTIDVHNIDVRDLRQSLGLTQQQFALAYGLEADTVQNWEQGRAKPQGAALVLLNLIEREPDTITALLAQ